MSKTAAALRKAKRRYAAGGALEKADKGDFRDSDPIRQAVRAVRDYYGGSFADPRKTGSTTAIRAPGPVVSNVAGKQDRGAPATDSMPAIWTGARTPPALPVSEDQAARDMNPIDRLRASMPSEWAPVSEDQAARNKSQNLYDAASVTPVLGNAMAARDALASAKKLPGLSGNVREQRKMAVQTGLSALGAVVGLPIGKLARDASKGASSRTNVFVPAGDGPMTKAVKEGRERGILPQEIYDKTRLFFGPEGTLKREIRDQRMKVADVRAAKPGDTATLGKIVDHPELFETFPDLKNHPVIFTDKVAGPQKMPVVRSDPQTGAFEISNQSLDPKRDLVKLIQYEIGKRTGAPAAMRHHNTAVTAEFERAAHLAVGSGADPKALNAYLRTIKSQNDEFQSNLERIGGQEASRRAGQKSAGNIEAKVVSTRAAELTGDQSRSGYPFARGAISQAAKLPKFQDFITLPPENATPATMKAFIENWYRYGSGKDAQAAALAEPRKFASGGKVAGALARARQKLAAGGLVGNTGGRSDKLPVKAAEGSYVVPADVVAALGEGNSMAGFKMLKGRFPGALGKGVKKPRLASGGAVPTGGRITPVDIIVSDGEFIVTPEDVAALGGGDVEYGHKILDDFVLHTRQRNIEELSQLPGPKQ